MRQLILDTETTGFDPKTGDRIVEFAALEMIDRKLTGNSLQLFINPERAIPTAATNIHGITDDMVRDKPIFNDVVEQIIEFISGAELIIHNAKFDISFMDYQFIDSGKLTTNNYVAGVIDTLQIARSKFFGARNSLDALCDRFEVDRSNRTYHGALIDCDLLAEVYLALTKEQMSLIENEVIGHQEAMKFTEFTGNDQLIRLSATKQDMMDHLEYLDKLDRASKGNCVWKKIDNE